MGENFIWIEKETIENGLSQPKKKRGGGTGVSPLLALRKLAASTKEKLTRIRTENTKRTGEPTHKRKTCFRK